MKKILLTTLIASMLIVPLGNTALAGHEEDALPVSAQDFVPGDTPAGNAAPEAMLPAVHGLILAMLNHDADEFDRTDTALAWESLYNMLSLYGELDSRCDESNGELFLLEETVRDYASALGIQLDELGPLRSFGTASTMTTPPRATSWSAAKPARSRSRWTAFRTARME